MDNFSSLDYFIWCYQAGGLKDAYQYMYNKFGIQYFPILFHSSESGFRGTKPITGIKDLKGLKIRLAGKIQTIVAQQLGFTPVSIDSTELYESLQRGVVDAGEFSVPASDLSLKLHEVAKYWWAPGWHQSAGCNGVMVNMDKWNSLPDAYKDAFAKAAELCTAESMARYAYEDFKATKQMIDSGVQICFYPEEDLRTITGLVQAATAQMAAENPDYAHVIASMDAYRKLADPYREVLDRYGWGYSYDEYSLQKTYPNAVYRK
jgi:TRAP-type mannitol/chloroaromatic compound transport system substrate-binding protein